MHSLSSLFGAPSYFGAQFAHFAFIIARVYFSLADADYIGRASRVSSLLLRTLSICVSALSLFYLAVVVCVVF